MCILVLNLRNTFSKTFSFLNCACYPVYANLVTSFGFSSHFHRSIYFMYHLFYILLGPMGRQPIGYMGSRDHLLSFLYFWCVTNKLTYLLTYYFCTINAKCNNDINIWYIAGFQELSLRQLRCTEFRYNDRTFQNIPDR